MSPIERSKDDPHRAKVVTPLTELEEWRPRGSLRAVTGFGESVLL